MKHFLYLLLPPRATFMQDMTQTEAAVMQMHAAYWKGLMEAGQAIVFGPVADPEGGYGMGVLELDDQLDPATIGNADPAIKANAGFSFEIHPMPRAMVRGSE
jgi:uncharacterized protein YciI